MKFVKGYLIVGSALGLFGVAGVSRAAKVRPIEEPMAHATIVFAVCVAAWPFVLTKAVKNTLDQQVGLVG